MRTTTRIIYGVVALVLLASAALAAPETRRVQGYIVDSARPGLQQPREFDLDAALSTGSVAAANVATVAVLERGDTFLHQSIFTITAASVTITDATTAGAHGGIQLYDFPQGLIYIFGASSDLAITAGAGGIADGAAVVCSLGEVVTETSNSTLTTTEITFAPSTAATLTAGAGACDIDGTTAIIAISNGTATAKDLFLDFAVPDADSTANDTLAVTGTVTLTWAQLGDN